MTYNVFSGTLNPTHSLTHFKCSTVMWNFGKVLNIVMEDELNHSLCMCLQIQCQWIWVRCSAVLLLYWVKSLTSRVIILVQTVFWLHVVHINLCGTALLVSTAVRWSVSDFYAVCMVFLWIQSREAGSSLSTVNGKGNTRSIVVVAMDLHLRTSW